MFQLPLRAKILVITLTILVATFAVHAIVVGYTFKQRLVRTLESESAYVAQGLNLQLDRLFALGLTLDGISGFEQQCSQAVEEHTDVAYAMVVDLDGKVLFHNDPDEIEKTVALDPKTLWKRQAATDVIEVENTGFLETTLPVVNSNDHILGAVKVGIPTSRVTQETSQLFAQFVGFGAVLLALAGTLLVSTLSLSVTRPLARLVRVIRRVGAASDLSERVAVSSSDELGQVGTAFNRMLQALQSSQGEVQAYARNLERKTNELSEVNDRLQGDIRERKKTEEALRQSEERFRSYFELSLLGMAILSTDHRWLEVNDKLCTISGYAREELRRMTLTEMLHEDDREGVRQELEHALHGATEGFPLDARLQRRNGERSYVTISARPVFRAENEVDYFIVLVLDITERKMAENALVQSQKLESLGLLAGGVAHDFNNLLTAMMVQSSLALGKVPRESTAYDHLQKVVTAAERASDLTRQLLAYSGRGQFEIQPLHLNTFIRESQPLLKLGIPKNIELCLELDASLPVVEADTGQMQQVVMNLVINATEAIAEAPGKITISTGFGELPSPRGHIWTFNREPLPPGEYATLSVRDTGPGMDAITLSKIFDPFFSTKFTGRGLGLAAVLGVVRGHRGAVHVQSSVGSGTTFTLFFPASKERKAASAMSEPDSNETKRGVVLVIDDEAFVREATTDILRSHDLQVITAADGRSGISLYRDRAHEIGLVILDLSMPGLSGVDTFAELKKIRPDAPVVMMSGYSEEEVTLRFANLDVMGFLKKPFRVPQLLDLVGRHMTSPLESRA